MKQPLSRKFILTHRIIGVVTLLATLLMGMVDAYTFLFKEGTFVSAQTGNIVELGIKLFSGDFKGMVLHAISLLGYLFGIFSGMRLSDRLGVGYKKRFIIFLIIQVAFFVTIALLHHIIWDGALILILGIIAGIEIDLFRKLGKISVNNGMMTGNTRKLMHNLYEAIYHHDKAAGSYAKSLSITIVVFLIGAGLGTLLIQYSELITVWSFVVVSILQLSLVCFFPKNEITELS